MFREPNGWQPQARIEMKSTGEHIKLDEVTHITKSNWQKTKLAGFVISFHSPKYS